MLIIFSSMIAALLENDKPKATSWKPRPCTFIQRSPHNEANAAHVSQYVGPQAAS